MKKRFSLTFVASLLILFTAAAQTSITVQSGDQVSFHTTLSAAVAAAQDGDAIYLPGGSYNIGNISIDKSLTIAGVGHYPGFSQATGITYLHGNINLLQGADNSILTGFFLTGEIRLGTTAENQQVNHLNITRCNVNNIWLSHDYLAGSITTSHTINITENVIRGDFGGGYAQFVLIAKNIICDRVIHFNGNVIFNNNIFLMNAPYYNPVLVNIQAALFNNNIFLSSNYVVGTGVTSAGFFNNIFVYNFEIPGYSYGSGNIVNVPQASIFQNQSGYSFSYDHDYHLKAESVGIGAGNDGFDIGIYGTSIPYKEGAVPFTPHIATQSVSPETNNEGQIEVNINVEAQQR